jgi:MFS family permease
MNDNLFKNRNFLLHWISNTISIAGDFFTFIAMPWLVLAITDNDPFVMAAVMATIGLPHGLFILFGGALTDRISPIKVLLVSRSLFLISMLIFAVLVYFSLASIPVIFAFAFAFGLFGAFTIPAGESILPMMVKEEQLEAANGMVIGTTQLAQIIGPMCAGLLIWWLTDIFGATTVNEQRGIALAFGIDALTFLISIIMLLFVKLEITFKPDNKNILTMVGDGFRMCWQDKGLRTILIYLVIVTFFANGPILAALPLLAKLNFGLGAEAYGGLYALYGVGSIIGAIIVSSIKISNISFGPFILIFDAISGIGFAMLGLISEMWEAYTLVFGMGICSGLVLVTSITWFQRRVPLQFMGRAMSIAMFTVLGLVPLAEALTGFMVSKFGLNIVMQLAGTIAFSVSFICLLLPGIRKMGQQPAVHMN